MELSWRKVNRVLSKAEEESNQILYLIALELMKSPCLHNRERKSMDCILEETKGTIGSFSVGLVAGVTLA